MTLISRPDYNQVFASQAPDIDKPAVFNNYPEGWGIESRPNNGKPTIKGFNYLQQTSDLKDLWILQNGACLPYDESIEYAEGAVVLKDGELQQWKDGSWQLVVDAVLPVAKGGTGATTVLEAHTNLGLGTAATAELTESNTDNTIGRVLKVGDFGIGTQGTKVYIDIGVLANLTEQYILLCKYTSGSSGRPMKSILGDIVLQRGGGGSANNLQVVNIEFQAAYNSEYISLKHQGPTVILDNLSRVTYQGVEYYAFHRQSTSDPSYRRYFNGTLGNILDEDKFLTVVDASSVTNVSVFPTVLQRAYTTSNTTVDSNGFIKAASPIVKLFADRIELNDEAQQQNIEFEKLGVGDYLIKGSSGFAQDGWHIETPKDANGNVLVAVVYEQLANGDISVKTHDYMLNNKGRIMADTETPLDITENRWIDLRLQELPSDTD